MLFGENWIDEIQEHWDKERQAMLAQQDKNLRERLAKDFDVPPNFMDLAVKIWWDGKED